MTRPAASQDSPWSHPIPRRDWPRRGALRLSLTADAAARARIAAELGLLDLPALSLTLELRAARGGDLVLTGRMRARAVQACSVTLAPVPATFDEPVTRRYVADWQDPAGEETEVPADTDSEPLPAAAIDAGFVAVEALALALPSWPRAPEAEFGGAAAAPPGAAAEPDGAPRPFAALARLHGAGGDRERGGDDGGDDSGDGGGDGGD